MNPHFPSLSSANKLSMNFHICLTYILDFYLKYYFWHVPTEKLLLQTDHWKNLLNGIQMQLELVPLLMHIILVPAK